MMIHTCNAEESLISALERRCRFTEMGCCLQIKGRFFEPEDFERLPQWIAGWVGDMHSEIFICYDHDIFVFSPYMTHHSYIQFKNIFQERFSLKNAASPISFYLIEESGSALIEAIFAKLEKRKINENKITAEEKRAKKESTANKFFDLHPSVEHLLSLRKKRESRKDIQILVVEDDAFSRKLISAAIGDQHAVSFSDNGYAAFIDYLTLAPDIVFLDINLPDVSGHDILIKLISFDPAAFPVMLSGNSNQDNIKLAMSLGAKGFVGKPFSKEKLFHYIQKSKQGSTMKAMA